MTAQIFCGSCGIVLEVSDTTSPKCGSQDRYISSQDGAELLEGSKLKQKDSAGFVQKTMTSRSKRAGRTGRKAEEELTIDRMSKTETIKTHKVWEENEEGQLVNVHDEREIFPAKHREVNGQK